MVLDEVHTDVIGALQVREGFGWLQYRRKEPVCAFANEVRAGIAGREEMGLCDEENMLRLALAEEALLRQHQRIGVSTLMHTVQT
jgi:hypothetical protein